MSFIFFLQGSYWKWKIAGGIFCEIALPNIAVHLINLELDFRQTMMCYVFDVVSLMLLCFFIVIIQITQQNENIRIYVCAILKRSYMLYACGQNKDKNLTSWRLLNKLYLACICVNKHIPPKLVTLGFYREDVEILFLHTSCTRIFHYCLYST